MSDNDLAFDSTAPIMVDNTLPIEQRDFLRELVAKEYLQQNEELLRLKERIPFLESQLERCESLLRSLR